jgi:thiamine-phosphate pyrophosphorylase
MDRENRKKMFQEVDVYPVTCEKLSGGRSDIEVLEGVIRGGAKIVQLREKEYSDRDFYDLAVKFREMTSEARVLLIINDRPDVALAVGADGVHLGQDNLPVAAVRRFAPELLIGASSHTLDEALRAQSDGADYVNIGPIFPTKTKAGVKDFLGPEAIAAVGPKLSLPFTVMGGINRSNISQVLANGARRIAMVTAITQAPDIAAEVRAFGEKIRNWRD